MSLSLDRRGALRTGSIVIFAVNLVLFVYKLAMGIFIHSYALVSDSFNSLTDSLVGLSMLAGVVYSYLPPDREHAFGHGRAEYIILFILAVTLIGTGVAILVGEYFDIRHLAVVRYSILYVILIAATIPVKFFLGVYVARIGRERSASFMSADYWHEQSDNLVTGAVIVGIFVSSFGYYYVDPAIGGAIAVFLIYLGISYGRKSINRLVGGQQSNQAIERAEAIARKVEGVRDVGKVEVHEYGERVVVNITVVLSGNLDASSAHTISHGVQDSLVDGGFYSAHVHVDTRKSSLMDEIDKAISELVATRDEVVGSHGLEVRESLDSSVAEIHLVFRKGITLDLAHKISHELDERFRERFEGYKLLTHIEPEDQNENVDAGRE